MLANLYIPIINADNFGIPLIYDAIDTIPPIPKVPPKCFTTTLKKMTLATTLKKMALDSEILNKCD